MDDSENELSNPVKLTSWLRFYNAMEHELGNPVFEIEGLQEWELDAWMEAFAEAQKVVAEADGVSYDALARKVRGIYRLRVGRESIDEWQGVPDVEKLKWKFMIRHLTNLLIIDPEDDGGPEQHEEQMLSLFVDKLKEMATV